MCSEIRQVFGFTYMLRERISNFRSGTENDREPSLDLTRGISSRCSSEDVREASCDIGKGW